MIDLLFEEVNKFCKVDKEQITKLYRHKDLREFLNELILTTDFDLTDDLQAIDYLRSNDPTFKKSIQIANELGIYPKEYSSVLLAYILKRFNISQAILRHFEQFHNAYKKSKLENK
jgi:hypothetical protein